MSYSRFEAMKLLAALEQGRDSAYVNDGGLEHGLADCLPEV